MEDKERKVPKLRFPGFTDDWEQRKLGELGETYQGLTGKSKIDFGHGDAHYVTYLNVYGNEITNLVQLDKIEIDEKQICVKKGDVFFTASSETPEEVGLSSVLMDNLDDTYLNSFCFGYRMNIEFDLYFLAALFRSEAFRKKVVLLGQGISRYNLSKKKMMDLKINYPIEEEQTKIGMLFYKLNLAITLYQRKLDDTKKLKNALLQKLFPKEGTNVPELRFPGFTDAWEQRKLGDLCENVYGGGTPKTSVSQYWNGNIPWIQSSDIELDGINKYSIKKYITDEAVNKSSVKIIPANSIAIVIRVGVGKIALLNQPYTTSQDFMSLTGFSDDSKFLAYNLFVLLKKEGVRTQGTSIKGITKQELLKWTLYVPNKDEQVCISNTLIQLDQYITLHQRKLDNMKKLKQSLLQQMFV